MKTRYVLLTMILAAGCNLPIGGENCTDDPAANHFALNPATGECWEFASSCDVPGDWSACGGGCNGNGDCQTGQICEAGTCVVHACMSDPECPAGTLCIGGSCQAVGGGCYSDDDCVLTQHCDFSHAPMADAISQGVCVDNAMCTIDTECPMGQWCDPNPPSGDECDPSIPGCGGGGAPQLTGLCSRGTRPITNTCFTGADCGSGQICPADYGFCSVMPFEPGVPLYCAANCENACYDNSACGTGFRCNNTDICAFPNPKPEVVRTPPVPPQCAGWCVAL